MAFGFGFNKEKVLAAAEKFVQQGKLQNAIAEYEKVLKADPKDLTVNNTVGDLYSRLGDNDKAVECFKTVGDAYAAQGFTVKAIAMYKKLTKSKPSLENTLRLAELYTQQGLFNDSRAQYLQVAEEFLRSGELEQAVRIFQKTLEMDPENVAMRTKLAEVYVRLNKKDEARQLYSQAAESLRTRGQLSAAADILQKLAALDPNDASVLMLRGKNALDAGDFATAAELLGKIGDLSSHPEAQQGLLQAYLELGRLSDAGNIAEQLFTKQNDVSVLVRYLDALMSAGEHEDALRVYQKHFDGLLAGDPAGLQQNLHAIIGHVSESPVNLESVMELLKKAGDNSHTAEILELLGHACVHSGELEKARDYYLELTKLEPHNAVHVQNYEQVLARLSGGPEPQTITIEEGSALIEELEATSPSLDQHYSPEVSHAIRAALTDSDLFVSYNMPDKALGPLLEVLPQAPRDLRLNQRLAALHTRSERFAEAGVCCRTLESLYYDGGFAENATRYAELAEKYEGRAGLGGIRIAESVEDQPLVADEIESPEPESVAEAAESPDEVTVDLVEENPVEIPEEASVEETAEFSVAPAVAEDSSGATEDFAVEAVSDTIASDSEIDLSDEWDGSSSETVEPVASESGGETSEAEPVEPVVAQAGGADELAVAETVEEIRFYIQQSMREEAYAALTKLEEMGPDPALLAELRAEVEGESRAHEAVDEVSLDEPSSAVVADEATVEEAEIPELEVASSEVPEPAEFETTPEVVVEAEAEAEPVQIAVTQPKEIAQESEPPFAAIFAEAPVPPPAAEADMPVVAEENPTSAEPTATGVLKEIAHDIESSLGTDFMADAPFEQSQPAPISPVAHAAAEPIPAKTGALGEFVADLEASLGNEFLPDAVTAKPDAAAASPTATSAPPMIPAAAQVPAAMAAAAPSSVLIAASQPSTPIVPAPSVSKGFDAGGTGVDLSDMFGELRHELEEGGSSDDNDPETHYNLGVAFREMGLLDEAIGELQKVCQAVEHGHPFPQLMQTYTWLAQCFLDKGLPEAAIRWYEQALKLPGLDGETRTALHYELASAYEGAGNKSQALEHFLITYSGNIDHRDTSERIQALRS